MILSSHVPRDGERRKRIKFALFPRRWKDERFAGTDDRTIWLEHILIEQQYEHSWGGSGWFTVNLHPVKRK